MTKILYISPENTVGVLSFWKRAHEMNGHECRFVTFFETAGGYENDIQLNLPLVAAKPWFIKTRVWMTRHLEHRTPWEDIGGNPPVWNPPAWQKGLIRLRELLWKPRIEKAIREFHLDDFDVYHFEWGTDFYRNGAFARRLKAAGKKIICHYHGQDMRNRGVIPVMDELSDLNLTNEFDLTFRHPNLKYLFLPFDVKSFEVRRGTGDPITICHATTNRKVKGSDEIIRICRELEQSHGIRFIFIENMPHEEAMRLKAQADIYIDQITDHAWGYGMNSLEALSMGIVCGTYLNPTYEAFIPDHPFLNVHASDLKEKLVGIIEHPELLRQMSSAGHEWVEKYHDYRNVVQKLYEYYRAIGVELT